MAKKKSDAAWLGFVLIVIAVGLLSSIPIQVWYLLGALAVVGFIVYVYRKSKRDVPTRQPPSGEQATERTLSTRSRLKRKPNAVRQSFAAGPGTGNTSAPMEKTLISPSATVVGEPVALAFPSPPPPASLPPPAPAAPSQQAPASRARGAPMEREPTRVVFPTAPENKFRIPTAPKGYGPGQWLAHGDEVEVAGLRIPGGLFYFGTSLPTSSGENDPCLIDPSKPVAAQGDYSERQMGYWPSYAQLSARARRSYLDWLAGGKRDPSADIGFVFLYFYGLERRTLFDALKDPEAKKDWHHIATELRRLLTVYGDKSGSFRGYAGSLLNLIQISEHPNQLYKEPVPDFPKSYELPPYIKLALGQCAVDGVPVPVHLAMAWVRSSPDTYLRTPATRCPVEFEKLFGEKYKQTLGDGLVLPRNKTKLKLVYNPASAGFRGRGEIRLTAEGIPDVTVLTAPYRKLLPIADAATKELDSYSRFVGKNPDAKASLEALLQLPATLWPATAQATVERLKSRMGSGMLTLSLKELLEALDSRSAPTGERIRSLARTLETVNIGMEPDVLAGAKAPKPEDPLVLFHVPQGDPASRDNPAYQAAILTLQLSAAVAAADGEFGAAEIGHLRHHIDSWTHLTQTHHRRLLAHLRLMMKAPVGLTTVKKKLEPLDQAAREAIASFMATVAQVDGTMSPAEVKALEKVYRVLGVDTKKVFSDVHAVAADNGKSQPKRPGAVAPTPSVSTLGFTLDTDRIAALQRDSDKVSALLSNIFRKEEVDAQQELPDATPLEDDAPAAHGLLGLDEAHTALARLLLTRKSWSRAELLDAAADLELMLDGALEQLNEAAFDRFDAAFTEGDDPVEVNHEVLEQIAA